LSRRDSARREKRRFNMAYDDTLAERIRRAVKIHPDVIEKKMFGGLAFLHKGKMFCGIVKDELMVRVGPERYEEPLRETHVRPMDFTGRPMKGYVFVESAGCRTDQEVRCWVERGADFVETLDRGTRSPQKKPRAR
jgi:TfoX/Sxy family transcriptional regulator of competence genes